ncbi:MAG: exonuclease domain-containing protein [Candidatus Helarchaeota archaeon]
MVMEQDIIIVIDVEATCWKSAPPKGQTNEIIEIGICLVDMEKIRRIDESKRSIIVKPERSYITEYCAHLTGLTQEQVERGILLKDACEILKNEYLAKKRTWASWGDYDRHQFERECKLKGIEFPFSSNHINVKREFARAMGLPKEVSIAKAMRIIKHPFEGRQHRGADDAYNIAFILAKLIAEKKI